MNPCVFTGALVVIEEYPAFIRCDIFEIGDVLIFTGFDQLHHVGSLPAEESGKVMNQRDAIISANRSVMKETQRFIATRKQDVQWSEKGYERYEYNRSFD